MGKTTEPTMCPIEGCSFETPFGQAACDEHAATCLLRRMILACVMPHCTNVVDPSMFYLYSCGHGPLCIPCLFDKGKEPSSEHKLLCELKEKPHQVGQLKDGMEKCPLCRREKCDTCEVHLIKMKPNCFKFKKRLAKLVNDHLDEEESGELSRRSIQRYLTLTVRQKAELEKTSEAEKAETERKMNLNNQRFVRAYVRTTMKERIFSGCTLIGKNGKNEALKKKMMKIRIELERKHQMGEIFSGEESEDEIFKEIEKRVDITRTEIVDETAPVQTFKRYKITVNGNEMSEDEAEIYGLQQYLNLKVENRELKLKMKEYGEDCDNTSSLKFAKTRELFRKKMQFEEDKVQMEIDAAEELAQQVRLEAELLEIAKIERNNENEEKLAQEKFEIELEKAVEEEERVAREKFDEEMKKKRARKESLLKKKFSKKVDKSRSEVENRKIGVQNQLNSSIAVSRNIERVYSAV